MKRTTVPTGAARYAKRAVVIGLAFVLLASACAAAVPPAAMPPAAMPSAAMPSAAMPSAAVPSVSPTTITIGLTANVLGAPLYVGVEKGIYLRHGIDLKISVAATGSDTIKGLQGGQSQAIATAWAAIVPLSTQGVSLKLFSLLIGKPDIGNYDQQFSVTVRPGVNAARIADLKGLKVATAFAGTSEAYIRAQLKSAGLNPDKDVTLVNAPAANMLSLIQTKGVDATVQTEPYGTLILAQVPGSHLVVRGGGFTEGRIILVTTSSWMAQNPALIDRIVAANLEATQYVRQHPDEAAIATSHYLSGSGLDVSVLTASLKLFDFDPRWTDRIQQAFEASSQDLVASGTVKLAPKATDILALDVLTGVQKQYPQYFSDLK